MTDNFETKVKQGSEALGISLSSGQIAQLFSYYEMLVEKNKVMNLTAITEENEVITKHILDSLSLASCTDLSEYREGGKAKGKLIDVGTGAGLPGMILKIAFPGLEITLFDSLKKRLVFLDEVISALSLTGIKTVHGRAEDFGKDPQYRENYDFAVSRAVANMSSLSEYCLPFVKKNGIFAAYKSAGSEQEIQNAAGAISKLGGKIEKEATFLLPDSDIQRSIVIVRKTAKTSPAYPRKAGIPAKDPLK